jgi:hypothetical protein
VYISLRARACRAPFRALAVGLATVADARDFHGIAEGGPGTEETFPCFVGKPWGYKLLAGDTVHTSSTLALMLGIALKNLSSWDAKATGSFSAGGPPVLDNVGLKGTLGVLQTLLRGQFPQIPVFLPPRPVEP